MYSKYDYAFYYSHFTLLLRLYSILYSPIPHLGTNGNMMMMDDDDDDTIQLVPLNFTIKQNDEQPLHEETKLSSMYVHFFFTSISLCVTDFYS